VRGASDLSGKIERVMQELEQGPLFRPDRSLLATFPAGENEQSGTWQATSHPEGKRGSASS